MDAKYCHFVRPSDILVRPWTHCPPIFGVHAQNLCVRDAGTPLNGTSAYAYILCIMVIAAAERRR
mgnify:CR=1 FL=1